MSEVKLLPLPEGELAGEMRWGAQVYGREEMHAYARANMEPLIAENERLRAKYQRAAESSEHFAARAERLAEALRKIAHFNLAQFTGPYDMACACVYEASAALDQEGGNG